jgi:hypothetical protein
MHCEQPFAHDGAHDVVGIIATDCHTVQVLTQEMSLGNGETEL